MKKILSKNLSIVLVLALLLTCLPIDNALASTVSDEKITIGREITDDMILTNTDTITVQDDEGNNIDVIVEEYSKTKNDGISLYGMYQEYPLGTKKTWTFKVSNEQLELVGVAKGTPLKEATKKKLASIIAKAIGEKITSAIVPILGWTAWILTASGLINASVGNNGFIATISGTYTKTYYHSGGYYVYGWSLNKPSIGTY